ncbi:sugar phosphate isomerase/epimerase family protein [Bryobacter aggregatus]|uniref:sugar phosphate isomerase/epimerase family protein n=1 Tax=Bryobacter aggregatus TaxID=360054 RepID=UPI0004E0C5AD|nr:sugar phosphate isomerase/epimerase family protein [Bryobacter aggregatus]
MKFGVNTFIWAAEFGQEQMPLLPGIKAGGFDGVEVPLFRASSFAAAEIRKGTEAAGLEVTICSVLVQGLSLISDDAEVRRQTLAHMKEVIAAGAEAGAKLIAGPLYSPVGYLPGRRRTSAEWKWAVEAYQTLGDTLRAHDVTIAIEPLNRFETYFLNTAADAARLCDEINHPNVGVLFDTFHANIEEKDIAAGYRTVGKHLKHVHTCENDRGIPGSGHVEWPSVFAALKELNYDGWLTIESFGFALGELSAAASIWRDIEKSPESIAFEGVKFLRQNVKS